MTDSELALFGLRFERVARIDSTNRALLQEPFGTQPALPRALLADEQFAGRGRLGRSWWGDPEHSLALSVAIERPADAVSWLGLPLAIGLTLAEQLQAYGAHVKLKWPNDLYVMQSGGWAKAGGVLIELRRSGRWQRVVVGCGLNLTVSAPLAQQVAAGDRAHEHSSDYGPPPAVPAGAHFADGAAPARLPLARSLATAVVATLLGYPITGLAPWRARWPEWDVLRDAAIEVRDAEGRCRVGRALGLDEQGALRVCYGEGDNATVLAEQVSLRLK